VVETEKYVSCQIKEDGSWITNPSPWVKEVLDKLVQAYGLSAEEVRQKVFLEGVGLAFFELAKKGEKEVIVRDLSDHSEKKVVAFGKEES